MIILWLAGALVVLWALLWLGSLVVLRQGGGEVAVDQERDINPHYFADMLRELLRPTLEPDWGDRGYGMVEMHRRMERVRRLDGDQTLFAAPADVAAVVVKGNLRIADRVQIPCDIWCLGDATVGADCHLRALAADGSLTVGNNTRFDRWVQARRDLRLGTAVGVTAQAVAGTELVLGSGFRGGSVSAPVIRMEQEHGKPAFDREAMLVEADCWLKLRQTREEKRVGFATREGFQWLVPQSVRANADFWTGPATILLHDLVVNNGSAEIGDDCVVAGSIHAGGELRVGQRCLITGQVACQGLVLGEGSVIIGAAHVDGDVLLEDGAAIGIARHPGGLAATGSIDITGTTAITLRIVAGRTLSTITGSAKRPSKGG